MRKLLVFLCVALLASSLVVGCKGPGLICSDDKDCCGPLVCNPWAGRCTKPPTAPPATSSPLTPTPPTSSPPTPPPATTPTTTKNPPQDPAAPPSDG